MAGLLLPQARAVGSEKNHNSYNSINLRTSRKKIHSAFLINAFY
jgi:hypothetical protein